MLTARPEQSRRVPGSVRLPAPRPPRTSQAGRRTVSRPIPNLGGQRVWRSFKRKRRHYPPYPFDLIGVEAGSPPARLGACDALRRIEKRIGVLGPGQFQVAEKLMKLHLRIEAQATCQSGCTRCSERTTCFQGDPQVSVQPGTQDAGRGLQAPSGNQRVLVDPLTHHRGRRVHRIAHTARDRIVAELRRRDTCAEGF